MADAKRNWLSKASRREMLAKLRCRRGRHNWQRIRNPESGDVYDRCHYCGRINHVDVVGNGTGPIRGVAGVTTGGVGGGF